MVWIDYDDGHAGGYPHECPRYCSVCANELTLEVGIVHSSTLADGAPFALYCQPCAPNRGKGYTLADLQQMREDGQVERAKYETSVMDRVGPDVYFAIKQPHEDNPT